MFFKKINHFQEKNPLKIENQLDTPKCKEEV
jgi:hypothetical protein